MRRAALVAASVTLAGAVSAADAGLDIMTASGRHHYQVETAADEASREHGLMDRRKMAANHGMLFEFPARAPVTFWMKDTYLPLDMVFIDADGSVVRVFENATPLSETLIASDAPVTAVLELNAGQAKAIGLKPGDRIAFAFFSR